MWYLVILLVTTSPLPGTIAYRMPNAHVVLPTYATESACKAEGDTQIARMVGGPSGLGTVPPNKKYVFTCVQIP